MTIAVSQNSAAAEHRDGDCWVRGAGRDGAVYEERCELPVDDHADRHEQAVQGGQDHTQGHQN